MILDIIKATYCVIVTRKSNFDKLVVLQRYLKLKYNISVGIDALKKREEEWKKEKKPC